MAFSEPDIKLYYDNLDQLLLQLKGEINSLSKAFISCSDQEGLDEYILELNTYYYQSFSDKIFPLYKASLEKEISSIYHLSMQEDILKKELVMYITRYAQLYNQIKSIMTVLKTSRTEANNLLYTSASPSGQISVDLLYDLKELQDSLNSVLIMLKNMQILLDDNKMLEAVNKYRFPPLINMEESNSKLSRDLNRIQSVIQIDINFLVKLQLNTEPSPAIRAIINELEQNNLEFIDKKLSSHMRNWYKQNIQKQYSQYIELIKLYADKSDNKRMIRIAQEFEDWLAILLHFLSQSKKYINQEKQGLLYYLHLFPGLKKKHLQEIEDYISASLKEINDLINSLSTSTNAIYEHYSVESTRILEDILQYLQEQINNKQTQIIPLLIITLKQLKRQIKYFISHINILNEDQQHNRQQGEHYRLVTNMFDSYLELLTTIKNDLEVILSPRTIKRRHGNMNIQLNHIQLLKGEILPQKAISLVDNISFEHHESNQEDFTVLHEEGDIFIISLDDLKEEIIPRIVISKKGK